jgi:tetratricopeptide (TPR) repeat protein
MMYRYCRLLLPAILFACTSLQAQPYKAPTGPAFNTLLKAYQTAFQTGELKGVQAAMPAMERAYPGHPYTLYFQGWLKHASGEDATGAMKLYSDAIRLMPELSDPYPMRAALFADKGMYERAVADVSKAIEIEGESAGAGWHSDRADYYILTGNNDAAIADFKTAIRKAPADAKYYRGLLNTAFKAGKTDEAVPVFTTALAGAQTGNGAVRMEYASLLMRQHKFADADVQSRRALTAAGFQPSSKDYNTAGIIAYKLKDYPRAASLLEKGIALNPADADIIVNRASVAIDERKWEEVYSWAQKALAASPRNPMANMMMAVGIKHTKRGDALAAEYEAKAKSLDAGK